MYGRIEPAEYLQLDLRAHQLLAGVPLHDVWRVDLPGGGPGRSLADLRPFTRAERLTQVNPVVRALFGLRLFLGRLFGWESQPAPDNVASLYRGRLTPADVERSLERPGTPDGPFTILYVFPDEAVSEIRNRTVHAFSVQALRPHGGGYRLYWAIYVAPVGRITGAYMALIGPFRHWFVYPAVLRYLQRQWSEHVLGAGAALAPDR